MEKLPVEVVGNILSRVSSIRDVVLASGTSRKWRHAFRKHLRVLSFKSSDWAGFRRLSTAQTELLITRTIFQTEGLRSLTIVADKVMSASAAMSWLLYTREFLLELHYDVRTEPALNVFEICGRKRLEKLTLARGVVDRVIDPNNQAPASLKSLTLSHVRITDPDLGALVNACPKLESLEIIDLDRQGHIGNLELVAHNLRRLYICEMCFNKIVLELGSIEDFHLRDCNLETLKLVGKGTLKIINLDNIVVPRISIGGSTENLETLDISNLLIPQPEFYWLVSRSPRLTALSLWDFADNSSSQAVDFDVIAQRCPQLRSLSIGCDLTNEEPIPYRFQGSTRFENLVYLKIGWSNVLKEEFVDLVMLLLGLSPNLRKLVVDAFLSCSMEQEDCQLLARFTNSLVRMMRTYPDLDVEFEYVNFKEI